VADDYTYSLDTSVLVNGWRKTYSPDVFPALWRKLDELIADGRVFAIDEVLRELSKQDDEILAWAKDREHMFVRIDSDGEIQVAVAEILSRFPRLVDSSKSRSIADPFVIALAKVRGYTVVTEEKFGGTIEKPKIPIVCQEMGIRCINLLQLVREQGWVFGSA
jgi:hypothetical protein